MFAAAIEKVANYTRPIKFISRNYMSETVVPGAATLFFVNDEGWAITCKHVAELLCAAEGINDRYELFKAERSSILAGSNSDHGIGELEVKYHFGQGITAELLVQALDCVSPICSISYFLHPNYDLAILHFEGFESIAYQSHAVFAKDSSSIRPGDYLCRLGYPFPEFTNFKYNASDDQIYWTEENGISTPRFPIDGMVTRHLIDESGKVWGIELSTPGLKGQSGGPLFNSDGIVLGMQSATNHLHLGFDMINTHLIINGEEMVINNQPFLHVGYCIHVDIIKRFLIENGVKFYIGNTMDEEEEING